MKPFLENNNNSLNLSDEELFNTFNDNNNNASPPPIMINSSNNLVTPLSTPAGAIATNSDLTNAINTDMDNNTSLAVVSNSSSSTPQSILKQTDYKIKINNKQNSKSFLPYSSPLSNSANLKHLRYNNNKSNSPHNADNALMMTKKEKLTLLVDDTPFFITSDLFSSHPNTYLGQ